MPIYENFDFWKSIYDDLGIVATACADKDIFNFRNKLFSVFTAQTVVTMSIV